MQVRLAALKREEEGLQREMERLETEKERHFRRARARLCHLPLSPLCHARPLQTLLQLVGPITLSTCDSIMYTSAL